MNLPYSEKNNETVFNDWKRYCKQGKQTPILILAKEPGKVNMHVNDRFSKVEIREMLETILMFYK